MFWKDDSAGKLQFHGHLGARILHFLISNFGLCKKLCLYGKKFENGPV
jgi:hypothetical protein